MKAIWLKNITCESQWRRCSDDFSQVQKLNTFTTSANRSSVAKIPQTFSHGHCFILDEKPERKTGSPVHILVLVCVDGSTILRPADGGFGDAGGLAGQGGLNVDCDSHIVAAVSDGRRDWERRANNISSVSG